MNLETVLNQKYPDLNETDREIMQFVVQNKKFVRDASLEEIAKKTMFSKSSIFRACKKLGLTGFSQLHYLLQEEAEANIPTTSVDYLAQTVRSLLWTVNQFKSTKLDDAYAMINSGNSVYIYATGWIQQIVAQQLQRNLFLIGKDAYVFPAAAEEMIIPRHNVTKNDLVIIISFNGMNNTVLHFIETLKMRGVHTLSFTSFRQNKIAQATDFNLYFEPVSKTISYEQRQENFFANLHILIDIFSMGLSNYIADHPQTSPPSEDAQANED